MEFGAQRFLEQGERRHPAHAAKLEFHFQQRRRDPALLLIAPAPERDAMRVAFETRHHALDQVGGMETLAQLLGDPQAMERQRSVEAVLQAARREFVLQSLLDRREADRDRRLDHRQHHRPDRAAVDGDLSDSGQIDHDEREVLSRGHGV